MYKILIIDTDDVSITMASAALEAAGYTVIVSHHSEKAIQLAKDEMPDLVLLELNMPEMDGIDVCIELCKLRELSEMMFVFCSERVEDYAQVAAFNAGADDYIIKPLKPRVLVSRIQALLKRHKLHLEIMQPIKGNGLQLDRDRYEVLLDGETVHFPRKEFELIWLLYHSPRKVFSRKEIGMKIWGQEIEPGNRTIDVHIRNIRSKIGEQFIQTVKGVGYYLNQEG